MDYASEKGASSWVSVLSIQGQNFHLYKSSFRDALCLRYCWEPSIFHPLVYVANLLLWSIALVVNMGGYPIHRHNDLRDYTASLFNKVCLDVSVEPPLQPLPGKQQSLRSVNRDEGVRLVIAATNFWSKNGPRAFFDIRVFNPLTQSNHTLSINSCYQKHKQEKRQRYN